MDTRLPAECQGCEYVETCEQVRQVLKLMDLLNGGTEESDGEPVEPVVIVLSRQRGPTRKPSGAIKVH